MSVIKFGFIIQLLFSNFLEAQLSFSSLDSLLGFADRNAISSKVLTQQTLLAKWTKVAALANTINFKSPVSLLSTNNLLLPVNFIPAEAFGGQPGTLRQITLGQQYVSNFNFNPQIDIINPQNWARVKSADLNKSMTEVNNLISKKALKESIAAAYFNCVALNAQILILEKNLSTSDSLAVIARNKMDLGIVREQDFNSAKVNNLLVQDKLNQLQINRQLQLNAIKILCDIPSGTALVVTYKETNSFLAAKPNNNLESKLAFLQDQYLKSELRAGRLSMLPVVSFVYFQGWQKNSNAGFYDNQATWIQSKYLGIRLTMPFPPDVTKLSQNYTSKVNSKIAALNSEHIHIQNEINNRNLELELEKTNSSLALSRQILELKESSYQKSLNQYKEGILPMENLLTAFTDLLNANNNMVVTKSALDYAKAKIQINNSFK